MKRINKRQITQGLREIGAAWATQNEKYLCANHNCCQPMDGDKAAYHIHPNADYPHQDDIKRFSNLVEIAGYIEACKKANEIVESAEGLDTYDHYHSDDPKSAYNPYYDRIADAARVMEDFWASLS